MIKRVNENKLHPFTAMVAMGGKYEGKIALHSCNKKNLSEAEEWAKERFNRLAIVVSDEEYPVYPENGSYDSEYTLLLYNEMLRKMWKAYKKERSLTNEDIAEILDMSADSVKTMTQPNKELPKWAVAMLYEWKQ